MARLKTLSNLRNCLTHARGIVTERHVNDERKLKIKWLGFDMGFDQDGNFSIISPETNAPLQAPDPAKPANIAIKIVEKERCFDINTAISIAPRDLQEICYFYLRLTELVLAKLNDFVTARGIKPIQQATEEGAG